MSNFSNILIVGIGGFIGSSLRYLFTEWAQKLSANAFIPMGTLGVNVIGCLVIGLLGGFSKNILAFSQSVRLFVLVGMLGGFTTFSTFGYETLSLLEDNHPVAAIVYVGGNLFLGLGCVWLGYSLSLIKVW